MVLKKVGSMLILEEGDLNVKINYDAIMTKIDDEINNSYIYGMVETKDEYDCFDLYYFKRKGITRDDYIESLKEIKNLIDKMFADEPTINILNFIPTTKKGKFAKNKVVNLATPVVGLVKNYDYYKYIEYFCLHTEVEDENNVYIRWGFLQSDFNKFSPIFFVDYNNPIIQEKLSAIKKADLKTGMIYSDENHKKFFLYLGYAKYLNKGVLKASKTLLGEEKFLEENILEDVEEYYNKKINNYKKYGDTFNPYNYLYIRLNKKGYEELMKKSSEDFETFITNIMTNSVKTMNSANIEPYIVCYDKPLRVFHEEHQYLTNVKGFTKVIRNGTKFIDNVSGPGYYAYLPKDTFTSCNYYYISYK